MLKTDMPGWKGIPKWFRWIMAADLTVCAAAWLWIVVHP